MDCRYPFGHCEFSYLKSKMKERIVILGAGESGTGAALLAHAKGYDVLVSDLGVIKEKYKAELILHGIAFEEGKHTYEKILSATMIIKSPGIADKTEIIKKAKEKNISILDEIEFAFQFMKGKIIAITGTNGKTTTTLLTYHLLKEAGFHVALAGNVGESLAKKVLSGQYDWYVVEMSSFQLDGTKTFRPDIGILLNITPDHLDRYEYQLPNYVHSKFQLVENMKATDRFIFYADDPITAREVAHRKLIPEIFKVSLKDTGCEAHFNGREMQFVLNGEEFGLEQKDTTLKGPHNLINTMCAVAAARMAGVPVAAIRQGLKTFKNAPHRLELVGVINGVEYINDSKATNVDSVVYALGSYSGPLVWIAGGIDKGNDYRQIEEAVREKVRTLICLGKDNTKLHQAFDRVVKEIKETQSVKELVRMASQSAQKGDVVLLSPACASFDLFKNYEDRGNQFREAVLEMAKEVTGK